MGEGTLGNGMMRSLTPDLNVFAAPGGLFDVSAPELEKNIGRLVRFKESHFPGLKRDYTIIGVQRIYDGRLAYRVQGASPFWDDGDYGHDQFGCPALPDEVRFLDAPTPVFRKAKLFAAYGHEGLRPVTITLYRDKGGARPYTSVGIDDELAPKRSDNTVVVEFSQKYRDVTIVSQRWFMLEWID